MSEKVEFQKKQYDRKKERKQTKRERKREIYKQRER